MTKTAQAAEVNYKIRIIGIIWSPISGHATSAGSACASAHTPSLVTCISASSGLGPLYCCWLVPPSIRVSHLCTPNTQASAPQMLQHGVAECSCQRHPPIKRACNFACHSPFVAATIGGILTLPQQSAHRLNTSSSKQSARHQAFYIAATVQQPNGFCGDHHIRLTQVILPPYTILLIFGK